MNNLNTIYEAEIKQYTKLFEKVTPFTYMYKYKDYQFYYATIEKFKKPTGRLIFFK